MTVGKYRVKLSADANSVTLTFTVTTLPTSPGAFSKTSPASGASGVSNTPTLSWSASSNASSYEYCIDTTNNNACDGTWTSTGRQTSVTPSALKLATTYYWQVQAKNAQGTIPADGGTWLAFTVSAPKAGAWHSTSLSGAVGPVTGLHFAVSGQANVSQFGFGFTESQFPFKPFTTCPSGPADSTENDGRRHQSPTDNSHRRPGPWTGDGSGVMSGTFDSPTSAHGTARFFSGGSWG